LANGVKNRFFPRLWSVYQKTTVKLKREEAAQIEGINPEPFRGSYIILIISK
jgi:hypothetical protein